VGFTFDAKALLPALMAKKNTQARIISWCAVCATVAIIGIRYSLLPVYQYDRPVYLSTARILGLVLGLVLGRGILSLVAIAETVPFGTAQ
jgi:hypothetical protein